MPNLNIFQPTENQVVVPGQPFQVSGQASDRGMPEPISIDSVTVKIDDGPSIDAQLSPIKNDKLTIAAFSATVTALGSRTHVLTVTATNDLGIQVTETVTFSTFPIVVLPQCYSERDAGTNLWAGANQSFTNWPQNIQFTAPAYYIPKTRAELAYAILQAESEGHHVRAVGSTWSFSDALCATDGSMVPPTLIPVRPGAMIDTRQLIASLQAELGQILAPGVDATFLVHVEAGITITNLNVLLDQQPVRQTLSSGGGRGQTLAGFISTSSHGGDSLVPPLADFVSAIHLVGAGGIEHWIEPDQGITDPAKLRVVYPCLTPGNIHYDTALFNAVLVSAGSMGVIYSIVLKTVNQFGLVQHQVATTWEALAAAGPDLAGVLDGSLMAGKYSLVNLIDGTPLSPPLGPFTGNMFSLIVINPYPLESNDATLPGTPLEAYLGQHLCFLTNRVRVPIPIPSNPQGAALDFKQVAQAARNALGSNVLDYDIRF
jgi:hypothetical protein